MRHLLVLVLVILSPLAFAEREFGEPPGKREVLADARPYDESMDESNKGLRRKPARSGETLSVGPALLGNLDSSGVCFYFSAGKAWAIGPITFGLRGDFSINPNHGSGTGIFTDFSFNLGYYFLDDDTSPFATADFGYGFARDGGSGSLAGGMVVGGTVGVALLRTYSTHLEIGLQGSLLINSAFLSTPNLLALRIGVSF